MHMSSITRSRLEVDYDKGVSGEFGIAKSSRLAQAIGVPIMLAIFAAA